MWSRDMQKIALSPPPLTMFTRNLVNLEKTSEMSPIKDEFLASYSRQNLIILTENWTKSALKLSIEGPILLVFENLSQIFSEGLLIIVINKVQGYSYKLQCIYPSKIWNPLKLIFTEPNIKLLNLISHFKSYI